jgi:predicted restriction endonuclease
LCAFCENNDPRDIQAAHIWDVHKLKILSKEGEDNKDLWDYSSDGHNGFWLCSIHHRSFDNNTLVLDNNGRILYNTMMSHRVIHELKKSITKKIIDSNIISDEFNFYINKRLDYLDINNYIPLY